MRKETLQVRTDEDYTASTRLKRAKRNNQKNPPPERPQTQELPHKKSPPKRGLVFHNWYIV